MRDIENIQLKNEAKRKEGKDTPIYRYISAERYFELIEKRENSFSHISMWEDPYEAFLLRTAADSAEQAGDEEAEKSVYDKYKFFYGQCWTICGDESDLRWRACGARGMVVRIKTTIKKLLESLPCDEKSSGPSFTAAGFVKYAKNQKAFDRLITRKNIQKILNDDCARMEMFFQKRKEFESEQEFRVIIESNDTILDREGDKDGRFLKFKIDPAVLVEEVLVDPCMSHREYEQLICRTRHRYHEIKIKQSGLFKWPRFRETEITKMLEFWQRLQCQYPDDGLNLNNRVPPSRTTWQISYRYGLSFFFEFSQSEATIYLYVISPNVPEDIIAILRAATTDAASPLYGMQWKDINGGRSHKIIKCYGHPVSIRNRNCWQSVIDWFCVEMPRFVQAVDAVIDTMR